MHATLRLAAAASTRAHKPMIHFLGKRSWPSIPAPPRPHPAAPAEFKESFSSFLAKFKASTMHDPVPTHQASAPLSTAATASNSQPAAAAKQNVQIIDDFLQLPQRLRTPELSEAEMEAITSGGASLYH